MEAEELSKDKQGRSSMMNPQSNFGKMDPYNDMEGIDEGPESSRRLINGK